MEAIVFVIFAALYFLPSIIGYNHRNANSICLLNLFLGWTAIGWIVALIWAVSKDKKEPTANEVKENNKSISNELFRLHTLMKQGAITETEYQNEKQKILNSNNR